MEWKHYFRNVVKRYSIEIQGWPGDIPLETVGDLSCARLEDLLKKLSNGTICWKKLTEDELAQREEEHALQIQNGDISASLPRRPRSDKGKKRKRTSGAATESDHDNDSDNVAGNAQAGPSGVQKRRSKRAKKVPVTSREFVDDDTNASDHSEYGV